MKYFYLLFSLLLAGYSWAQTRVISVLYFENATRNSEFEWLHKGLADILITDLSSSPQIKVVERENLEKLLKEQQLQLSGVVSEKDAVTMGELLQARTLIYGSFIIQGQNLRIDARITDVETGRIENTMKIDGSTDEIMSVLQEFSKRVFLELVLEPMSESGPDVNVEAVKNYYQGIDLLDRGNIDEAMKKFRLSSQIDPLYNKPQKSMEEAYRFLKDFKRLRYQREINELYELASLIRQRMKQKPFMTYAELTLSKNYALLNAEQRAEFNKKYVAYYKGDTPVQLAWNYILTLQEIGGKAQEYFEDEATYQQMLKEIIKVSQQVRRQHPKDSFLPEIIYQELMAHYWLENYQDSLRIAEELMLHYPDYRMMWAIENFYEQSLEKLQKK